MQKTKYFTCIYHKILFFCSKRRELQNIATNHSADIDYKDFMSIYNTCTSEPDYFLTIDTTLPAMTL